MMDQQTPTPSTPIAPDAATATASSAGTTSQSAEPSPAQPPQSTPQLQQQEPPPTLSQPAPVPTPPASAPAPPTPSPKPNPNPAPKPPSSLAQPQPATPSTTTGAATAAAAAAAAVTRSSTKTPIVHRPWQQLNPHANFTHFPSSTTPPPPASAPSLSSSASSPISAPQQRATVAIGVPAAHPSPSPSPFSSPFGQQFGGLSRPTTSITESVANTSKSQVRPGPQGLQGIGMMGSMSSSAQVRPGGISAHHQQRPVQSSIRPSASSPSNQSPTSQNFQGHSFLRSSTVGPGSPAGPAPSTSQSIQSASQPWLSSGSQGKPPLPSPSYRPQLSSPSLQQRAYSPQQHLSLPTAAQQQQTPSPQPTQSLTPHQPPEHYGQQFPPSRAHPSPHPQQVTKVQGAVNQKPASPAVVQPATAQSVMHNRTHNTESDESGNRIVGKRSIHELVSQIDPSERLDPEVEEILADIAEEFVESITTFGCSLAKHRKSDTLEAKDILLHLERNWNMTLPGFSSDEIKTYRKPHVNDIHKERLAAVKKSILASDMVNSKNAIGQAAGNMRGNLTKTSTNSMLSPNLKIREVT